MKHDTIEKYSAGHFDLTQSALLTTWDCLAAYRDDLVLVGGLAVRYLTKRAPEGLPDAVTLDVDFGISIAATCDQYGSIRQTLSAHGFQWDSGRFVRTFKGVPLYIDLLTDAAESKSRSAVLDDGLSVSVVPGIERALAKYRSIEVVGETLLGAPLVLPVKIADVGPMLVLKLNAFGGPTGRKAPKDAHDIAYLGLNYLDGLSHAVAAFTEEKAAKNRGMESALQSLQKYFEHEDALGPVYCAAFRLNNQHQTAEKADESLRIRQECVSLARELLG